VRPRNTTSPPSNSVKPAIAEAGSISGASAQNLALFPSYLQINFSMGPAEETLANEARRTAKPIVLIKTLTSSADRKVQSQNTSEVRNRKRIFEHLVA
jgi:hypothetical protein